MRSTSTFTCDKVRLTKFLVKSSVSFGSPTNPATKLRPCWCSMYCLAILDIIFDYLYYYL